MSEVPTFSPEQAATEELIAATEALFSSPESIVNSFTTIGGDEVDEIALAIPGTYNHTKGHEAKSLAGMRLRRFMEQDGTTKYVYLSDDEGGYFGQEEWQPGGVATQRLSGVGAQMEGDLHPLDLSKIEDIKHQLSIAIPYDPNKYAVRKGRNGDSLVRTSVLGRLGSLVSPR